MTSKPQNWGLEREASLFKVKSWGDEGDRLTSNPQSWGLECEVSCFEAK
ncbi:hypothetical protein [Calothrix sp. NIES-2100]